MNRAEPMYHSDMSLCTPPSALSRDSGDKGCWTLVDYTTEDGVEGVTMYATQESSPPAVSLSLNVKGFHEVYIGIHYTRSSGALRQGIWGGGGKTEIKLSGDKYFETFAYEEYTRHAIGVYPPKTGHESEAWASIQEVYWRTVDLTGQDIVFAQTDPSIMANVAYVKLVALDEAGISEANKALPREDTKRLFVAIATPMWAGDLHGSNPVNPPGEEDIADYFEPLRDTDVGKVTLSCVRGDICIYPSKIGKPFGLPAGEWDSSWLDPVAHVRELTREMELELFLGMRMVGATLPPLRFAHEKAGYFWENLKWALRDREGNPASHLSLAYPEVRAYWISYFRELLAYDPEGVNVLFNRSRPFVLYEDPVVESFQEKYNLDPRDLPFDDQRWLRHRAGFVTQFLREIRGMLDEEGEKAGKRYKTAHHFFLHGSDDPLLIALDAEAWIKEKLVDDLIIHTVFLPSSDAPEIVRKYKGLTAGTEIKLYPDIYPRNNPAEAYAQKIGDLYRAGADGFAFWGWRNGRVSELAMIKMLGHKDLLTGPEAERWVQKANTYYRRVPLKLLNGIVANPYLSYTDG